MGVEGCGDADAGLNYRLLPHGTHWSVCPLLLSDRFVVKVGRRQCHVKRVARVITL